MTERELGRLEEVASRLAWSNEAHDFTPWLAEHLDELSTVIGFPLELIESESAVGAFSADILARNPANDTRVVIENQLEQSDHRHLGQLMTYLAGLKGEVVIWIATSFTEPHLAAIKWLNDHTVEPFAFFAVRVKVVRIGNSPLAPVFEAVERPNDWERRQTEFARLQSANASEIGRQRLAFWERYLELFPDESSHGAASGTISRWREMPDLGLAIALNVGKGEVGVFVRGLRGASQAAVLELLSPCESELSAALGVGMNDRTGTGFYRQHKSGDPLGENDSDELMRWLHETADRYELTMRNILGKK